MVVALAIAMVTVAEPVPDTVVSTRVQFAPPSPVAVPVNLKNVGIPPSVLVLSGKSDLLTVTLACDTPPFCKSTLNVPVPVVPDVFTQSKAPSITLALVTVKVTEVTVVAVAIEVVVFLFRTAASAPASAPANVVAPVRFCAVPLANRVAIDYAAALRDLPLGQPRFFFGIATTVRAAASRSRTSLI